MSSEFAAEHSHGGAVPRGHIALHRGTRQLRARVPQQPAALPQARPGAAVSGAVRGDA